jgi:hypothetical protein
VLDAMPELALHHWSMVLNHLIFLPYQAAALALQLGALTVSAAGSYKCFKPHLRMIKPQRRRLQMIEPQRQHLQMINPQRQCHAPTKRAISALATAHVSLQPSPC